MTLRDLQSRLTKWTDGIVGYSVKRLLSLCLVAIVAFVLCVCQLFAEVQHAEIGYTFSFPKSGGMSVVTIDELTGKILGQEIKYQSSYCTNPKKLRAAGDGTTFIITHDHETRPFVFIVDTVNRNRSRLVELPGTPDEVRIAGTQAIVTCTRDYLATIDIPSRRVVGTWDTSNYLKPPANHPQDILLTPDEKHAIVSFQKDSPGGKKLGGRLAVFSLPGMDVVADVVLSRDYSDWELPNEIRRTGPGLELLFLDVENDTLLSTADHYGAVALMRWSELKSGSLQRLEYRSTAFDGTWGYSFPDRGTQLAIGESSYCLICNSGADGGSVLIDLASWKVSKRLDTAYGLEKPVFVPSLRRAYSTCPGKHKTRKRAEIVKQYFPQPLLTVFEVPQKDAQKISARSVRFDLNLFQLGVLERSGTTPLFVISAGKQKANRILVFDPATEKIVDQAEAIGSIHQFQK